MLLTQPPQLLVLSVAQDFGLLFSKGFIILHVPLSLVGGFLDTN